MRSNSRLFNCARCHEQVIICTDCDRGQIYCANGCAKLVRQASLHAANTRYQQTRKGKHKHAHRQHQYRLRQKEISTKVTYQGFPGNSDHDVLPLSPAKSKKTKLDSNLVGLHCHFCKKPVPNFLRTVFLTPAHRHDKTRVIKMT